MDNSARREKILQLLQGSPSPITGTALAKACDVSRQIIVGDVALMRAQGTDIISTPRGYQLVTPVVPGCTRVFVCCHGLDQMEGELNAIVDNGGIVRNVVIEHEVYGNLEGTLNLPVGMSSSTSSACKMPMRKCSAPSAAASTRISSKRRRKKNSRPSARPCATSASYIKIDIFFLSLYNSAM